VHDVALVEFQLNDALPPADTAGTFVVSVAVGITLTVTLAGTLVPPGPVHVMP